jgi:hypothetical protein
MCLEAAFFKKKYDIRASKKAFAWIGFSGVA